MAAVDETDQQTPVWDGDAFGAVAFQTRARNSAMLDAAWHLREAIVLCLLPPGAKLPTEPELARRLGVGVVTVRTVLSQLRAEGFIVTRRGRYGGSWVASADAVVAASLRSTPFDCDALREQSEVLIGLEAQAMGLAAERATAEERAEIVAIAAHPRDHFDVHERQRHSNVFHLRVAEAARNGDLLASIRRYRARLQEQRTVAVGHLVFCSNNHNYLLAIAEAIADGDADAARNLCHRFLSECWGCNFEVIGYAAGVDGRDVDLVGPLDVRRYR